MLELLGLLLTTVLASVRPRQDLILENLVLRHQLAVLTRPTRSRRRARLRPWDKLLWCWLAGSSSAGAYGRRELVHVNVTANPTAAWVWRQVIEATPWGQKPRHLLRDRDAVYGRDFRQRARQIGIDSVVTPIRAPRANAVVERVIGTLRRECFDHLIIRDEHHLLSVVREFVAYYNQDRPHRTLGLQTPEPRPRPTIGPIRSRPVLNGLHHVYERAA